MKVFFGLLLIVNIAFAAFQWFLPYEQLFGESKKVPAGEQLKLLSEAGDRVVSEPEVVAKVEAKTDEIAEAVERIEEKIETQRQPVVTEAAIDKRVCYTIGPIKDKSRAIEVSGRYSGNGVETELKSSLEKQYLGMMVYIDGHKTRAQALKTANDLATRGIRDHIVINDDERTNLLSLGVFGLKKNADRLRDRVAKMNFPVKTEARYRERTIYWLYAEQDSEAEMLRLLDDGEFDDGISQIPTQCLPT